MLRGLAENYQQLAYLWGGSVSKRLEDGARGWCLVQNLPLLPEARDLEHLI